MAEIVFGKKQPVNTAMKYLLIRAAVSVLLAASVSCSRKAEESETVVSETPDSVRSSPPARPEGATPSPDLVRDILWQRQTYRLQLRKAEILSPQFRLLVQVPAARAKANPSIYFQQANPINGEIMYYQVNPDTLAIPSFFFGTISGRPGWSVSALRKRDGSLSGHVFSPRGEHFRFQDFAKGDGGGGSVSQVSTPIVTEFYSPCLGGNLQRDDWYSGKSSALDVREYDLVFDSDSTTFKARFDQTRRNLPDNERIVLAAQQVIDAMFLAYAEIAIVTLRDSLMLPRLKTLVARTDSRSSPYVTVASLKTSQTKMWSDGHAKGIALSRALGTANAGRGGFACQVRRLDPATYLHEHFHCLGTQHNIAGSPEQFDMMTGGHADSIRRASGPTVKIVRTDCTEKKGFRAVSPTEFGLPPYAALDLAEVRRGAREPIIIDAVANDAVSSGANIELVEVDAQSARGQSVALKDGKIEYTPPADWIGLDSFFYTIRSADSGEWLYARGLVHVEVHDRVARYQAEDVCSRSQKRDDASLIGAHGNGYAALSRKFATPLKWELGAPRKGYHGIKIRYQEAGVSRRTPRVTAVIELSIPGGVVRFKLPSQKTVQQNRTQWGLLCVPGLQLPAGRSLVELRLVSGSVNIDSIDLEEGLNLQINFENGIEERLSESHFLFDHGNALGKQPSSAGRLTYGWSQRKRNLVPQSAVKGRANSRMLDTTIPVGNDKWSMLLPNGKYRVGVFCGDSNNRIRQVNNLVANDQPLIDADGVFALDDSGKPLLAEDGRQIYDPVDFLTGVILVTQRRLEIKAGRKAVNPSLSYIEILRLE